MTQSPSRRIATEVDLAGFAPLASPALTGTPTVNGTPIGSGGGSTVAAYEKPGAFFPSGWGANLKTKMLASAANLVEWVVFGDSATYGSCTTFGVNFYSWTQKLRALILAAGYTDGGRGIVYIDAGDNAATNGDGLTALVSQTGFTALSGGYDVTPGATSSDTPGDTITIQGRCTAIRLMYSRTNLTGRFSYAVDGGAATTIKPGAATFVPVALLAASGLTDGVHSITVTNIGGNAIVGVASLTDGNNDNGSGTNIPAGTYYWRVAFTTASGETTPGTGVVGPVTMDGAHGRVFFCNSPATAINAKLYRSTTLNGGYKLVATTAAIQNTFIYDNTVTPGADALTVSTAGYDSANHCGFNVQFIRDAGVVVHKDAISGTQYNDYFGTANATAIPARGQIALGITPGFTGSANGFDWGMPKAAGNAYRTPAVAITALGINDMQGQSIAVEGSPTTAEMTQVATSIAGVQSKIEHFARLADAAGAAKLVVIPHFDMASHGHTFGGMYHAAISSVARANGCAVIDFNQAIRPVSTMASRGLGAPGVHSEVGAYDAEATFLWTHVAAALGISA